MPLACYHTVTSPGSVLEPEDEREDMDEPSHAERPRALSRLPPMYFLVKQLKHDLPARIACSVSTVNGRRYCVNYERSMLPFRTSTKYQSLVCTSDEKAISTRYVQTFRAGVPSCCRGNILPRVTVYAELSFVLYR